MEPFPESATLGWLIGLAIGAALVTCVVIGLILGYWPRKERQLHNRKRGRMNAVEIEEAISALAGQPFDPEEFPFAFLQAFGNKETTLKRLRKGESNKSDLGGVLQTNNIHIAAAVPGEVTTTLAALKASP